MISSAIQEINPQPGFQTQFLASPADIVIGGGAAGAGKSFALLLEYPRNVAVPKWGGVVFRRLRTQVMAEQGLWDVSKDIFTRLPLSMRPRSNQTRLTWTFPSGAKLQFSHLQHEKDKLNWQGSQIGYLGFDELTQFTKSQFFYLLTRNRSTSGIRPYCRATTNPQGYGWVKNLVSWWIYPDDHPDTRLSGFPIPERAGVVRYFTRYKGHYVWGMTPVEVLENLPASVAAEYDIHSIKSITFVPGTLDDNRILQRLDPNYKANLLAQDEELMLQLLKGRWSITGDDWLRLFNFNALLDCFTNDFVEYGDRYITADIAFEGADKFVIAVWSGFRLIEMISVDKSTGPSVIRDIERVARKYRIPGSRIAFDSGGVGNYLKGFMRSSVAVNSSSTPIKVDGQKQNYNNLRSQLFFLLKQKINDYEMFFDVSNEMLIDKIVEQLFAHTRVPGGATDVLRVVPADELRAELGESPDYAVAIALRMIFELVETKGKRSARSG